MYTFPPLPDTISLSLSLTTTSLLDLGFSYILLNTITCLISFCVILVSPSLESSVGLVTIRRLTQLSLFLKRDEETYFPRHQILFLAFFCAHQVHKGLKLHLIGDTCPHGCLNTHCASHTPHTPRTSRTSRPHTFSPSPTTQPWLLNLVLVHKEWHTMRCILLPPPHLSSVHPPPPTTHLHRMFLLNSP